MAKIYGERHNCDRQGTDARMQALQSIGAPNEDLRSCFKWKKLNERAIGTGVCRVLGSPVVFALHEGAADRFACLSPMTYSEEEVHDGLTHWQ
jgi:hypothetical protein